MKDYILLSDYMENDKYRRSFNKLAKGTFGLDFEEWYQKELFYNRYTCYSYIKDEEVVANVSVNKMDLIVEGQKKKALQIGTVMTHPSYRNQGLSAALMDHVIEKYENHYDFIYLFANDSVLDFYPKFGFKKIIETSYRLDTKQLKQNNGIMRRITKHQEEDYETIMRLGTNRVPVSKKLGVYNDIWPLLVYCCYLYRDNLYYLETEDIIVVAEREDKTLHIYDVIGAKPFQLDYIIERIVSAEDKHIEFHFMPELNKYKVSKTCKIKSDDTLFIRNKNIPFNEVLFPMTSHT